jgi:hypothetical protein
MTETICRSWAANLTLRAAVPGSFGADDVPRVSESGTASEPEDSGARRSDSRSDGICGPASSPRPASGRSKPGGQGGEAEVADEERCFGWCGWAGEGAAAAAAADPVAGDARIVSQ